MSANGEFTSRVHHFQFGSNSFVNGQEMSITVDGERLIRLERRLTGDGQLLLTAELYDENGNRLGRVVRNTWVSAPGSSSKFEAFADSNHITMINTETKEEIFHAQIATDDFIVVDRALMFGRQGSKIDAFPDGIRFYNPGTDTVMVTLSGNTVIGSPNPIDFSPGGFGMG